MSAASRERRAVLARDALRYATELAAARSTQDLERKAILDAVESIVAAYAHDTVLTVDTVLRLGAALVRAQESELAARYRAVKGLQDGAAQAKGYLNRIDLERKVDIVANALYIARRLGRSGKKLLSIKDALPLVQGEIERKTGRRVSFSQAKRDYRKKFPRG